MPAKPHSTGSTNRKGTVAARRPYVAATPHVLDRSAAFSNLGEHDAAPRCWKRTIQVPLYLVWPSIGANLTQVKRGKSMKRGRLGRFHALRRNRTNGLS